MYKTPTSNNFASDVMQKYVKMCKIAKFSAPTRKHICRANYCIIYSSLFGLDTGGGGGGGKDG